MSDITKERLKDLLESTRGGIWLSMDGNCGCALLGKDMVVGEAELAEFSEIKAEDIKQHGERKASCMAMKRALKQMHDRCGEIVRWNTMDAPDFGD